MSKSRINIGLLLYPGCVVSGLFSFAELLEVANKRAGIEVFNLSWVGLDKGDVEITTGTRMPVTKMSVEESLLNADLDAVLIPGFWTDRQSKAKQALVQYEPMVNALKRLPKKTKVWGYCTGVCMIAASGRLQGQTATATWWLASFVQSRFTGVDWSLSQTYVDSTDAVTASGLSGYLPIAQSLIEQHCGQDVLKDIVDLMIIPKPEKSSSPFNQIKLIGLEDNLLRKIYVWVEKTPASQLNTTLLASALKATERTLARKVKEATQLSLALFMRLIKLHQASDLLIYSNLPVNVISEKLGFSDDASFRRTFKRVSGNTPVEYRQNFKR